MENETNQFLDNPKQPKNWEDYIAEFDAMLETYRAKMKSEGVGRDGSSLISSLQLNKLQN